LLQDHTLARKHAREYQVIEKTGYLSFQMEIPIFPLVALLLGGFHDQRLTLSRTDIGAIAAPGAIQGALTGSSSPSSRAMTS
jgi:hypothetical protein